MNTVEDKRDEVFLLLAEENYAHARDHEQLRAQVTSTLVAAAFVLIGLVIDKHVQGNELIYASILAVLLGLLNIVLVVIHNNRFEWHVSIAREARDQLSLVPAIKGKVRKRWSLYVAWLVVACLPLLAGIGLLFVRWLP